MQLNKFTDYALRILMYVAQPREDVYTISELATRLQVSENHVMKIVHFMSKESWLITTRGKGGGIRLHPDTPQLTLGKIVKTLQGNSQIVECNTPPCVLRRSCGLKIILDQALDSFYQSLDQYLFAEVMKNTNMRLSLDSPIPFIQI